MIKPPIMPLIIEGILKLAMIVLVLCSALFLNSQLLTAMVLIECAQVFRAIHSLYSFHDLPRENVKRFFKYVIPGAITIVVIYVVGIYVSEPTVSKILEYVAKIAVLVLAFPIVIPMSHIDRSDDKFILSVRKLSSFQKFLYKLFAIISRGLIIIGFLIIIFAKKYSDFYFEILVIIGCVVWYCRLVLHQVWWRKCELVTDNEEPAYKPQTTENNGQTINGREVERIVQKIADRWSYREETSAMVSQGRIRYNVTVEVVGYNFINYTISGKISGARDDELSSAYTYFDGKMDKAAFKIVEETKNELSKHNLPDSYEVSVKKGYIE